MTTARAAAVLACCLSLGVTACRGVRDARSARANSTQLSAGDHTFTIRHGGRNRSYIVHVPRSLRDPAPVLLAFHGGGGNALQFKRSAEIDAVSDRNGFIAVYPNGTGPLPARLLTWNAGDGCCGYALNNDVDDVGFSAAVVDDLAARISIDRQRVYATGHSNGGMMSHRIGAERADLVAAIAPVAGALDLTRISHVVQVPVLHIHSVDDPRALYDGGLGPPFPGTDNRVQHKGVMAGINLWIAANGCATGADTSEVRTGSARTGQTVQTAILLVWRPCRGGAEVAHWRLTGSGHGWPGNTPAAGGALVGPQTTLIIAAEEVWRFVSRFAR
jgi:polyhydroxybutyrate depolymerase